MTPPKNDAEKKKTIPEDYLEKRRRSARLAATPGLSTPKETIEHIPKMSLSVDASTSTSAAMSTSQPTNIPKPPSDQPQDEEIHQSTSVPEEVHTQQTDDPDPPKADASDLEIESYQKEVISYSKDMLDAYKETSMTGQMLWHDFRTAFRPNSIKLWSRPAMTIWVDFLVKRGVHVDTSGKKNRANAIIELLYRKKHIPPRRIEYVDYRTEEEPKDSYSVNDDDRTERIDGTIENQRPREPRATNELEDDDQTVVIDEEIAHAGAPKLTKQSGDPDDDDPSTDEDDKRDHNSRKPEQKEVNWNQPTKRFQTQSSQVTSKRDDYQPHTLGLAGLVKAFDKEDKFSGSYGDDLERSIRRFKTLTKMCQIPEVDKLQAMPIMLKGDALDFFDDGQDECVTYEDALELLRKWYHSAEQRARVLARWQTIRLSEEMRNKPDESELSVFRSFIAELIKLQKQLDSKYQGDGYLIDQLLTAVDLPEIQATLKDRMPRKAQNAIHRIANRLSDKPKTAGTMSMVMAAYDEQLEEHGIEAMYSLGRRFGGDAKKEFRPYRKPFKGGSSKQNNDRGTNRPYRLRSSWMRGARGCFVCGKDHRANDRHPREEVSEAIRRLKQKHPSALLTIGDLDAIYNADGKQDTSEQSDTDDEVQWAKDVDDDSDFGFLTVLQGTAIEAELSKEAFTHGFRYPGKYSYDKSTSDDIHRGEEEPIMNANINPTTHDHITPENINTQHTQRKDTNNEISIKNDTEYTENDNTCTAANSTYINENKEQKFLGIRIDTCANRRSIMAITQYTAYCTSFNLKGLMKPVGNKKVRGIGGICKAIGEARIQIPFHDLGIIIDVNFLIIPHDIPTLLSLKDLLDNDLDLSIQNQTLSHKGRNQKLQLSNYFLIYTWAPTDQPYVFYTFNELKRIHATFGHPTIKATKNLLRRASGQDPDQETKTSLIKITEDCTTCAKHSAAPRRFKLTIGSESLRFNHDVQVDTMWIDGKPVVHMVDTATHFTAARFVRRQTSMEVWRAIRRMWTLVYCGPPDYLHVDQGSNYTSHEFKEAAREDGVNIREAPIETPGAIGTVERYHAPLRRAYSTIRNNTDKTIGNDDCLMMATFAVNSVIGPEGLCPMLLVYGALPRPARITPAETQQQRAYAIDHAMKEVEKEQARRRINFGLTHYAGPRAVEQSKELRRLPAGAPVWIWRTNLKQWDGPHKFISIEGETAIVQTPKHRRIFRSTCVKPYTKSLLEQNITEPDTHDALISNDTKGTDFAQSRKLELDGLIHNGTFKVIAHSEVPQGTRIFGSRFVDELKRAEQGYRKKSRLVAQNYNDNGSTSIATKAPTVARFSQRLLLALAVSLPNTKLFTRDITQAYVQSKTLLERPVFIKAPQELGLSHDMVLRVMKPLYGIPESGLHWYLTYLEHHIEKLGMTRARTDPCILIKRNNGIVEGLVALQVDDSLAIGTEGFLDIEETESKTFKSKDRGFIDDKLLRFNGLTLTKSNDNTIHMTQTDKIDKLQLPTTQQEFTSARALAQYIGVCSRPDVCAAVQLLAPGKDPTTDKEMKELCKAITYLQDTKGHGLNYHKLDLQSMKLVVISDAAFGNARGFKSQLGYLVLLSDKFGTTNVIHYASNRCKRVTRSVLAAELHALVLAFDHAYVIQDLVSEILGRPISIEAYIDSKTLFDVVVKDSGTTEKRLQIDIFALKQSYELGELSRINWIPGTRNPADPLTKHILNDKNPLWILMNTNKYETTPLGWATASSHKPKVVGV